MKFKIYYQTDSMQCGIACLRMICKHFGQNYSSEFLSKYCFASNEGVSILGISEAAQTIGLHSVAGRISIEQIKKAPLPCILHWNQNHFVVLYKISSNKKYFYIADPAKGAIKYSLEDLKQYWLSTRTNNEEKGVAIFMKTTTSFGHMTDFSYNRKHSFKFLFGYIKQYHKYLIQVVLGLLIGCILQLIMPFLTQAIVDIGIKYKQLNFIHLVLLGEFIIVTGKTITDFIRRWIVLHISIRVNISLISDFFIKLLRLPMSFFDTKMTGDLLQRMNDHNRIQTFLTNHILNLSFTVLGVIVFGTVLFVYNTTIFGIFIITSIIYGIWIASFLKKRKVLDYELFEQQAICQNKTFHFITTMQEIKLQDCEQRRRWEWENSQADLFNLQLKLLKLQQTQEAGSIFINELKNITITFLSASAVINGNMSLGAMLAIQYIIGQLNSPIEQLMGFIYSVQDVRISLERINEIHQTQNEEDKNGDLTILKNDEKYINFNNVYFKYDPHAIKYILSDISLKIPQGKVTAIVGASGSGKTTLIKLMLGYYPVLAGNISIGMNDIKEYNLKWWRKQCGVVMQDGVIFSESIARNIAIDDGEINKERLKKAAEIANIHEYIMKLPLKYNTQIGMDGVGLSQGQKQRILIARAVYKNPRYIFLDEATNALDAENERVIVENLNDFYQGRTVVVVAHRLSTVKNADQIIVLGHGKILETGNHASLIEKKGAYYHLVKNQLELGN